MDLPPAALKEMEKLQAKGDVDESELKALEMDVTGKVDLLFFSTETWHSYFDFPDNVGLLAWRPTWSNTSVERGCR